MPGHVQPYCIIAASLCILLQSAQAQIQQPSIDPVSYLASQAKGPSYTVAGVWERHEHVPNWQEVHRVTADTWDVLPKAYDPAFKNPCWKVDQPDGRSSLKCLPYFQILGVSKCGTTDLYHRLARHNDIVECAWKGPHFFDETRYPSHAKPNRDGYDGTFQAYVNLYDKMAVSIAQDPAVRITGEASSNTYTGVLAFVRGPTIAKRTNATLAQYLKEATPFARFIVLCRDPVDRYHSAYHYYRHNWTSTPEALEEFHRKAEADILHWNDCVARQGEARCLAHYSPQQLIKGMYAAFLPYWLSEFPRDQMLIIRTEDYKAAPQQHVQASLDFLGVRSQIGIGMARAPGSAPTKLSGVRNQKRYNPMLPKTRQLLEEFYRPYNQRMAELNGNDPRWLWGY
mmetsp:Transcript_22066/g.61109  ORF Transcript_22066/g.61109 Transcript_22066/m.61109 type:complete len:398 (-) Transcript_22066:272-1465(-)